MLQALVGFLSVVTGMNRTVFTKLVGLHLITPGGLVRLLGSFVWEGVSLMALMRFSASYYPHRCALVSAGQRFTYQELYEKARQLARLLYAAHGLKAGMCVGLLCRNHVMLTLLLPALSRLGVRVKLVNTDMAPLEMEALVRNSPIHLLIYDSELKAQCVPGARSCGMIESGALYRELMTSESARPTRLPFVWRGGELSVFTGGSNGHRKEAPRGMHVCQFLPPFCALLEELHIDTYDSVFLPLPLYHGFGLATLVVSFLMGKKVCLMNRFDAAEALMMISDDEIEVLPVVPAMLARLWQVGGAANSMKSVKCIICGGDRLDRKWIDTTTAHLGKVLYNLYGTSEAGFFMIASPDDLLRYEEVTIGRPVRGVTCKVERQDPHGVGSLWVRSHWATISLKGRWQDTGDLVYANSEGYYFYRGRTDNMVVCGGENVYPEHVEKVINSHQEVLTSIVFPVADSQFGQVLHATVELKAGSALTPEVLKDWLRPRLSRSERPHQITVKPITVLETGKLARHHQSH